MRFDRLGCFHISQSFNHILVWALGYNCPGPNCLPRKMDSLAFYFQALEFHPVDLTAIRRERLLLQGWLSEKKQKVTTTQSVLLLLSAYTKI